MGEYLLPKFELGKVVSTTRVYDKMLTERSFMVFVHQSLARYLRCDWGDTCEADSKQNDYAVEHGERILAVYKDAFSGVTIWIITEWDRSTTTILFPDEY